MYLSELWDETNVKGSRETKTQTAEKLLFTYNLKNTSDVLVIVSK